MVIAPTAWKLKKMPGFGIGKEWANFVYQIIE